MRHLIRLFLAVLGTLAGLLCAEGLVRAFDPYGASYHREVPRFLSQAIWFPADAVRPAGRLFEHRPDLRLHPRGFRFWTDSRGLRISAQESAPVEPENTDAQPAEAPLRVLCIGDSVTLCWGVDQEFGWPALLEAEGRAPDGRRLEVLNAGHLIYNTIQEVDWALAHMADLAPDWLLVTLVSNDLDDNWTKYQQLFGGGGGEAPPARLVALASRYLPGLMGVRQFAAERGALRAEPAKGAQLTVEQRPEYQAGMPLALAALDRLLERCRELGTELILLDHCVPHLPGFKTWALEHQVRYADVNFDAAEWAQPVRNSAADEHSNALGNRLHANRVLTYLKSQGLLAR